MVFTVPRGVLKSGRITRASHLLTTPHKLQAIPAKAPHGPRRVSAYLSRYFSRLVVNLPRSADLTAIVALL